jgi:hypothetical protein
MTVPTITALPDFPVRGEDPVTFATKANDSVAAYPTMVTQMNAMGEFVEDEAAAAETARLAAVAQVALAEAQVALAEGFADQAENAQAAAEAASNAEAWVSGGSYVAGDVVWSPITFLSYRANTTTSGTTDPSLSDDWTALLPVPVSTASIVEVNKSVTFASAPGGRNVRSLALDSNRRFFLVAGSTSMHAVVYDDSTQTFGTPALVRTAAVGNVMQAVLANTDEVLVVSAVTTALEAVVLSISGTTITVNTAATATLAGAVVNETGFGPLIDAQTSNGILPIGGAFLFGYTRASTIAGIRAITISGTTPTIGNETATTGTGIVPILYAVTSSVALVLSQVANSTITATCYTIAGTSITAGSSTTITSNKTGFLVREVGSRWAVICQKSNTEVSGDIISVSSTTPTTSSVVLATTTAASGLLSCRVVGSQVVVGISDGSNAARFNVLTDSSGTAGAGTTLSVLTTNGAAWTPYGESATELWGFVTYVTGRGVFVSVGISGSNPIINYRYVASTAPYEFTNATQLYKSNGIGVHDKMIVGSLGTVSAPTRTGAGVALTLVYDGSSMKWLPYAQNGNNSDSDSTKIDDSSLWVISQASSTGTITTHTFARVKAL